MRVGAFRRTTGLLIPDDGGYGLIQTYSITELAREFDVTPRAIRFYEDQGLLAPARAGSAKSRVYSSRDRTRLKLAPAAGLNRWQSCATFEAFTRASSASAATT